MPCIAAPRPRTTSVSRRQSRSIKPTMPPPLLQPTKHDNAHELLPPFQLMSPIHIGESNSQQSPSIATFQTPCNPKPRRNSSPRDHSPLFRHSSRSTLHFEPTSSTSFFDHLPWIAAMDSSSDLYDPCSLADLSQVGLDERVGAPVSGPIRRRKTSLRSNPLGNALERAHINSSWAASASQPDQTWTRPHSSPRTPRSRGICLSRVDFYDLMPVFPIFPWHDDEHCQRNAA